MKVTTSYKVSIQTYFKGNYVIKELTFNHTCDEDENIFDYEKIVMRIAKDKGYNNITIQSEPVAFYETKEY